jgi:glycerol-3-phosphate dehydrogenase
MSKVAFLGGGSFGTSLAILLGNKGNDVSIYDRNISVVNDININRKNDTCLDLHHQYDNHENSAHILLSLWQLDIVQSHIHRDKEYCS